MGCPAEAKLTSVDPLLILPSRLPFPTESYGHACTCINPRTVSLDAMRKPTSCPVNRGRPGWCAGQRSPGALQTHPCSPVSSSRGVVPYRTDSAMGVHLPKVLKDKRKRSDSPKVNSKQRQCSTDRVPAPPRAPRRTLPWPRGEGVLAQASQVRDASHWKETRRACHSRNKT